jgi:hypothetical protein
MFTTTQVLGKIQEVFGPISTPFYTVRWKNAEKVTMPSNERGGGQNRSKGSKNRGNKNKSSGAKAATDVEDEDKNNLSSVGAELAVATEVRHSSSATEGGTVGIDSPMVQKSEEMTAMAATIEESAGAHTIHTVQPDTDDSARTEEKTPSGQGTLNLQDVCAIFPVGAKVYTLNAHCSYVMPHQIRQLIGKGSDASNAYDEEVFLSTYCVVLCFLKFCCKFCMCLKLLINIYCYS